MISKDKFKVMISQMEQSTMKKINNVIINVLKLKLILEKIKRNLLKKINVVNVKPKDYKG